jgi:hypothetical protein
MPEAKITLKDFAKRYCVPNRWVLSRWLSHEQALSVHA